jgi:hypothetical protein
MGKQKFCQRVEGISGSRNSDARAPLQLRVSCIVGAIAFSLKGLPCLTDEIVALQRRLDVVFLDRQGRGLLAFRVVSVHFVVWRIERQRRSDCERVSVYTEKADK